MFEVSSLLVRIRAKVDFPVFLEPAMRITGGCVAEDFLVRKVSADFHGSGMVRVGIAVAAVKIYGRSVQVLPLLTGEYTYRREGMGTFFT